MPLMAPPPSPSPGTLSIAWLNSYGAVLDLTTSTTYLVRPEALGWGTAGSSVTGEKNPQAPGSTVRRLAIPPSRLTLPISVFADSQGALLSALDTLWGWFDTGDETRRAPGYLQITRPDGSIRQIQCYNNSDAQGDLSKGSDVWTEVTFDLYAPDPWPTAPAETVTIWTAANLPLVSQINEGQMDAYPRWRITGPATQINVANLTTGKNWSLTFSLAAGKWVDVDTRPPNQRVTLPVLDSDGVNRFPNLFAGSRIFGNWLVPGINVFSIALLGTSGLTRVQLAYLPRYRGMMR